jgi:polyribonucleotide nucleotidyltransferase
MKHLEEDPWDAVETNFPVDSEVKGKIVRMLDRGVVVELADGLEGFVPVSKLTAEYIKVPADAFRLATNSGSRYRNRSEQSQALPLCGRLLQEPRICGTANLDEFS